MRSKYFSVEVQPVITSQTVNYSANDVLFDWTRFEIPLGTARLVSIMATIPGTDGAAANELDADIYFAKSVDGVDPPTLGNSNTALSNTKAIAARPHMIGGGRWDGTELADLGGAFTSYNLYNGSLMTAGAAGVTSKSAPILLEGERSELTTYVEDNETVRGTSGYQAIYMAASAQGVYNFGTAMLVDNGPGYAEGSTSINLDGTAGDILVAPGDRLLALNDGAVLGYVEAVTDDGSHTTITIKSPGINMAIQDGDEIGLLYPITYRLGFEY